MKIQVFETAQSFILENIENAKCISYKSKNKWHFKLHTTCKTVFPVTSLVMFLCR